MTHDVPEAALMLRSYFEAIVHGDSHVDAARAALSRRVPASGDEYVPCIIRNDSAGFYEFVTEDVPALYGGMMAANVERIGKLQGGDLIGFRIYDETPIPEGKADPADNWEEWCRAWHIAVDAAALTLGLPVGMGAAEFVEAVRALAVSPRVAAPEGWPISARSP